MNYEQLWKDLKKDCENNAEEFKARMELAEKSKNEADAETWRKEYELQTNRLESMLRRERSQQSTEREAIEGALDELRRDRKFERYRIKRLTFNCPGYREEYLMNYKDYRLYRDGTKWRILFIDGDRMTDMFWFDKVEIEYWEQ